MDSKCNIICLQKTKWDTQSSFRVRNVCPPWFNSFLCKDAISTSGGILIAWVDDFSYSFKQTNVYSCSVILERDSFSFMLTCLYGPNDDVLRLEFLKELRQVRELNQLPWMVVSDFNLVRDLNETTGGSRNLGSILEFNHLMEELELWEVPLQGQEFTWSSKRPTPTFYKIDRILLSQHWNNSNLILSLPMVSPSLRSRTLICL